MVMSYSAIARPSSDTPTVINIASSSTVAPAATSSVQEDGPQEAAPQPPADVAVSPEAASSQPIASTSKSADIKHLILDAGPLLSLTPLRHLATSFHTTPMVFAELRDQKARDHWKMLDVAGLDVRIEQPTAEAMSKVTAFARKTGDFAVLSQADLSVIALTYQYEVLENGSAHIRTELGQKKPTGQAKPEAPSSSSGPQASGSNGGPEEAQVEAEDEGEDSEDDEESEGESVDEEEEAELDDVEQVTQSIEQVLLDSKPEDQLEPPLEQDTAWSTVPTVPTESSTTLDDEDEESDGGEWITPANVTTHRNHDLGLLPADNGKAGEEAKPLAAACMTGDFAVQNVLLGMGLGLVGEGGKRIGKVKSFVLRCHACFKICKDSSRKFCPSCGNPSLLRTTVTVDSKTGQQKIHLKKNFQYHLRGTKYTIPDAKPGRAKGQLKGGTGLVLREDQAEWQDAVRSQRIKKQKEEKKAANGVLSGWDDPDWLPEIITVGMSGKGRSGGPGMPTIGHGRKNPNASRRKR